MRGFIRRATGEEIIEYADLIKTLAQKDPEQLALFDIRNRGLIRVELTRLRCLVSLAERNVEVKAV